jgi:hypothetical protein
MKQESSQPIWLKNTKNNKGQIFVEYILLLLVAISTAALINRALTKDSDDPNDAGVLRKQWYRILTVIANDRQN